MFKFKKADPDAAVKIGIYCALVEAMYILLVALFFMVGESIFPLQSFGVIIGTMAFLSLAVISAGVSAALVLGYPFYFAIQKKYKEALVCVGTIILTLLIVFMVLLLAGLLIR